MLEVEDLHVGYGQGTVLHGVSLEVPGGSAAAVLGHNGAGKSTLLKAVIGLLGPRRGRVRFDGRDVTRLAPHARVRLGMAYVPQGQQCFPQLSTAENLRLVADGPGRGGSGLEAALEVFPELRGLLPRPAGLLSGGQRQQLAIARALIARPRLLLLDEPTEGIQPSVVATIQEVVSGLIGQGGLSVLLVEQHVAFALSTGARCTVLESGRVRVAGAHGPNTEATVRTALSI